MSSYLDDILNAQNQRKVTGRGAFTGDQVEAAFQGDIAARYQSEERSRTESARESEFSQNLALQRDQLDTQKSIGQQQTIVSGVGAIGQLGLGYAAASKAGLFGSTAPGTTGAATQGAITGAGSGAGMYGGSGVTYAADGTSVAASGTEAGFSATSASGAASGTEAGFSATSASGAGVIGALVVAGLGLKSVGATQSGSGWVEKTLQSSSQHPASLIDPGTVVTDMGIVGKDTFAGKIMTSSGDVENWFMNGVSSVLSVIGINVGGKK